MPSRARSQSVATNRPQRAQSETPVLAVNSKYPSLREVISNVIGGALGKRKRAPSPSPSISDSGESTPKRKRGRSARAVSVTPSTNESSKAAVAAKIVVRADLLAPPSHARPARHIFVWGNGDMGQFGLGTETLGDIVRPRLHSWFERAVPSGILGKEPGAGVETLCAGGMHSLVVDEVGKVWTFGINDNAALGRSTVNVPDPENPSSFVDSEILESQPLVVESLVQEGFRAVKVSAGDSISVALGSTGQLRVWGSFRASDGLLGFDGKPGSSKTQIIPLSLPTLQQYQFVGVACGTDHVLALTTTGHVYVWGNGQQAQLGRKIIERRKINGLAPERLALRKVARVGSGSYHSFAIDHKGIVYAWGLNSMRQTGVNSDKGGREAIIPIPTPVDALDPKNLGGRTVVSISGGEHHTLFLLSDGSVWGCGRCDGFELGLAEDHPAMKDVEVRRQEAEQRWREKRAREVTKRAREALKRAAKAAAAGDARDEDDNEEDSKAPQTSEKPPPTDEYVPEPVPIIFPPPPASSNSPDDPTLPPWNDSAYTAPPMDPIIHISAGTRHNLAVTKMGYVYAWGFSTQCALGLGRDVEFAKTPQRVKSKGMEGWHVEMAAAGGQHCLVLARRLVG